MDKEKVIYELEECLKLLNCAGMEEQCRQHILNALTFLKEKKTVTIHDPGGFCPECSWVLGPGERPLTFVGEDDI